MWANTPFILCMRPLESNLLNSDRNVMWKMIALDRADKNFNENLTDTTMCKDSGFYNTKSSALTTELAETT